MERGVGLNSKILAIILILTLFLGGVFGTNTLTLTPTTTNTLSTITANINFDSTDYNSACFSIEDNNAKTKCIEGLSAGDIDLNYQIVNGLSDNNSEGSYTIYFYTKLDDGNFTTPDSKDLNIDRSPPEYTSSITDGNYYNYKPEIDINFYDTYSGIKDSNIYLNGNLITSPHTPTDLNQGLQTITVDANDNIDYRLEDEINFYYDTTIPVIATITPVDWTNNITPEINIIATDNENTMTSGIAKIWCIEESQADEFTISSGKVTSFNITAHADCNDIDGNKPIFIKVKDTAGNYSSTKESYILFDSTPPGNPRELQILEEGNEYVWIKWKAPSTADEHSGTEGYQIFKGNDEYSKEYEQDGDWLKKKITGLTNGNSYSFGVKAYDNANNYSEKVITSGTPRQTDCDCDLIVERDGKSIDYVKGNDDLDITCDIQEVSDDVRIRYRYETNSVQNLTNQIDNTSTISDELNVDEDYSRVTIWCEWRYDGYDYTSTSKTIYIDTEQPQLTWGDFDSNYQGVKEVWVEAEDNEQIDELEFEFNNIKNNYNKRSGNEYTFYLDTEDYSNGKYTLKAIAKDKAGNIKSITKTITINNPLDQNQIATKEINNSKSKKQEVEDLIKFFENKGIEFDTNLLLDKNNADKILLEAQNQTTNTNKISKAKEATSIYKEIITKASNTNTVPSAKYEFSAETITSKLNGLGLTQDQIQKASAMILSSNVERKLSIIKIGDTYNAQIEISLKLDGNKETYKIIEFIPKELVKSAKDIFSNTDFTIIEDDPIIEFTVSKDTETIYYSTQVDENKASELMDSNIITNFAAPPVILGGEEKITILQNQGIENILIILLTIIGIVVLVGIIGVIYIGYSENNLNGLGHNKKGNVIDTVKKKVEKITGSKEKKKWKYKGK